MIDSLDKTPEPKERRGSVDCDGLRENDLNWLFDVRSGFTH